MNEPDSISDVIEVDPDLDVLGDEETAVASERVVPGNAGQLMARDLKSLTAINQPLISSQLVKSLTAINQPLISSQLVKSLTAINQPLISSQLVKSLTAINQPLISSQLVKSLTAINQPLISSQLVKSLTAINQPLISSQLVKSLTAINRPLLDPRLMKSIAVLDPSRFPALNHTLRADTTREQPEIWLDSYSTDAEDSSLTDEEKSYWLMRFDTVVKDDGLRRVCRPLFADGYYSLAVQKAWIYIDNMVGQKSGRGDKDGADLMWTVFSPNNPILRLNDLQTRSDMNEQQGYMHIFAGAMTGIRNPRVHEHDLEDSPEEAWELLVMANHLMRVLTRSASA